MANQAPLAAWDAALAAYRAAYASQMAHPYSSTNEDEKGFRRLERAMCRAYDRLLRTPAPDTKAIEARHRASKQVTVIFHEDDAAKLFRADLRDVKALMAAKPDRPSTAEWDAALADYREKRAASDAIPSSDKAGDAFVDVYCEAMDRLLEMRAPDDTALLALFAEYARALKAFEEDGDPDDDDHPLTVAWNDSRDALDAAPPPTTTAGVIALLRFGLAVNETHHELQALLMWGSVDDRAQYGRENWETLDIQDRPQWGALLSLEAMEGGR